MLGSFLFSSLATSKLSVVTGNFLLVLCNGISVLFVPVLLWSKPSSFMGKNPYNFWQINATFPLLYLLGWQQTDCMCHWKYYMDCFA